MEISLSQKQSQILQSITDWFLAPKNNYLTLGGYAGTGKTTLIAYLTQLLRKDNPKLKIAFCSYTGKASRVLKQKLDELKAIQKGDSVSTIHRLIYSPLLDNSGEIIGWEKRALDKFPYKLIIIDEASMLNKTIWTDLLSYNVPVLAVGDHGQLPPIEGTFSLMDKPDLKLEEIYRQQQDNPLIKLSIMARQDGYIPIGRYSQGVMKLSNTENETQETITDILREFNSETMVLVGYNHSRVKINKAVRGLLEIEQIEPQVGDRVICLKNNHKIQIFNGMSGTLRSIFSEEIDNKNFYNVEIEFDGEDGMFRGLISPTQFNNLTTEEKMNGANYELFDFSYALTVHKAQGSQAQRVIVFEERFKQMDDLAWSRWLYTAVTRASESLYIVGS